MASLEFTHFVYNIDHALQSMATTKHAAHFTRIIETRLDAATISVLALFVTSDGTRTHSSI